MYKDREREQMKGEIMHYLEVQTCYKEDEGDDADGDGAEEHQVEHGGVDCHAPARAVVVRVVLLHKQ